jgi:RHS repeat-associated protein
VIDGDHRGLNAGNNSNWTSNGNSLPQWVEVAFNGSKTINQIDVFSLQDYYENPVEPTEATTFSLYGLTAFEVQYWNGSTWVTVPGGSVSGNNKVWKKITFAPITTTKIRVYITATSDNWSRIVEVEAWSATPGANINWLVTDHLGTPRMIIDQTGNLPNVKRHDYLPFGEELFAQQGLRTAPLGYVSGDGVRQQFTAKERDNETGLDYFLARYYSNLQGRFTSADSFAGSRGNPQTLNLYSYVQNDPLNFSDPTGHFADPGSWNPTRCALFGGFGCNGEPMYQGQSSRKKLPPRTEGGPLGTDIKNPCHKDSPGCNPVNLGAVTVTWSEPTLPPSILDVLPVTGSVRAFLFNYTTHNFEGALGSFAVLSLELVPAVAIARSAKVGVSLGLRYAPEAAEAGLTGLHEASTYGIQSYNTLRELVRGTGLHVHHLIEKRFASVLEIAPGNMKSIVLTSTEHAVFTKAWRQAIPYGAGTANATKQQITAAARKIYAEYPAILSALGIL